MTVQANLGGSSNITGSRTPRGTTPIQRIRGASPIPRFQPTNSTRATGSSNSQSSGTRTPLKRVGPIPVHGPSTQDAPQLHGAGNIANQSPKDPAEAISTYNNAPLTNTTGIQKSGKSLVASSSARKVQPQKIESSSLLSFLTVAVVFRFGRAKVRRSK